MPSICQPCTEPHHTPEQCSNQHVPMIARSCRCECQVPETDPAPYWTHTARSGRRDLEEEPVVR